MNIIYISKVTTPNPRILRSLGLRVLRRGGSFQTKSAPGWGCGFYLVKSGAMTNQPIKKKTMLTAAWRNALFQFRFPNIHSARNGRAMKRGGL